MVEFPACVPPIASRQPRFVPELHRIGQATFSIGHPDRPRYEHGARCWWLAYLSEGRCEWFDGERIRSLDAPHLLAVPPGLNRGGFDQIRQAVQVHWAAVDPERLFAGITGGSRVLRRLQQLWRRSWRCDQALDPWFERLRRDVEIQGPLAALQTRETLRFLVAEVIRLDDAADADAPPQPHRPSLDRQPESVRFASRRLTSDLRSPIPIADVAAELAMSTSQLYRLFKRHLGVSPKAYLQQARLDRARELLMQGRFPHQIPQAIGLATTAELRRLFVRAVGCQPERWVSSQMRLWAKGRKQG